MRVEAAHIQEKQLSVNFIKLGECQRVLSASLIIRPKNSFTFTPFSYSYKTQVKFLDRFVYILPSPSALTPHSVDLLRLNFFPPFFPFFFSFFLSSGVRDSRNDLRFSAFSCRNMISLARAVNITIINLRLTCTRINPKVGGL